MIRYNIAEVVPHYQPIVQLSTGKIVSYESLARFVGVDGKKMFPGDVGHLFENPEFLWELFERMFPKVVEHAQTGVPIAVNVDVHSLTERFFYFIEHVFHKYPGAKENIHFEVTERSIGRGMDELCEYVNTIRGLGSKVVLDDFGTGGANIECLEQIRFDHVKIDGQFLKAAEMSRGGRKRLQIIVDLLRSYDGVNMPIVAEHIENAHIEAIARDLGIECGQGYYYGAAVPMIKESAVRTLRNDPVAMMVNQ